MKGAVASGRPGRKAKEPTEKTVGRRPEVNPRHLDAESPLLNESARMDLEKTGEPVTCKDPSVSNQYPPGPADCLQLEGLLAPLAFAVRNDFAGLERLRGLEELILARLAAARASGEVEKSGIDEMQTTVTGLDAEAPEDRKQSLRCFIALLGRWVPLPAELRDVASKRDSRSAEREGELRHTENVRGGGEGALREARAKRSPRRRGLTEGCEPEGDDVLGKSPLNAPISSMRGVGQSRAKALAARGIRTVKDALCFLPVSYERRVRTSCLAKLEPGSRATVRARVRSAGERRLGRRRRVFEVIVADESAQLRVRYYHSGQWLARRFQEGAEVGLSGAVRLGRDRVLEMAHPELVDPAEADCTGTSSDDAIVPRYSEVEGLPAKIVRDIVGSALIEADLLPEVLPAGLVEKRRLLSPALAMRGLHQPAPGTSLDALESHATEAQRRLVYEELFFLQLGLALKARGVKVEPGIPFSVEEKSIEEALALLPFSLTKAQLRSIGEIAEDMARPEPMHRLLQGDVGSGKTAVAAVALTLAARSGWQGAVMTPTELLAEQHHRTLTELLGPAGLSVVLLSGRLKASDRRTALRALSDGEAHVVVGTQALIQDSVDFRRLGLVVVDEQHRFGVRQRATLMDKGVRPDTLVMTATPIPRTLAMTAYGDLDLSIIDELPPGRVPVTTRLFGARDRVKVWDEVKGHVAAGRQAFIVYPIVESSEHMEEVKAATEMASELDAEIFTDLRVGLIHGRMPSADKDAVMSAFSRGEIPILVATTVVEVGIDVPNATVMVIEHAERFGLSQLHQLRGRVGRGADRSYCYLVAHEARGERVRDRLGVMTRTCDGFAIAEEDLRIRGPGEVLGTRQSGHPDLLFGNLARDRAILSQARSDAFSLVASDPELSRPEHKIAAREVLARWGRRIQLGRVA